MKGTELEQDINDERGVSKSTSIGSVELNKEAQIEEDVTKAAVVTEEKNV